MCCRYGDIFCVILRYIVLFDVVYPFPLMVSPMVRCVSDDFSGKEYFEVVGMCCICYINVMLVNYLVKLFCFTGDIKLYYFSIIQQFIGLDYILLL